jgi:hypothetical protein
MAFALLSQEKQMISRAFNLKGFIQSNAQNLRLLHILLDESDQQVLAFGTREAHNALQLFSFPATVTNSDINITAVQKLPDMTHQSKFMAAIYAFSSGSLAQRDLLIAVMEGRTVRIVRASKVSSYALDWDNRPAMGKKFSAETSVEHDWATYDDLYQNPDPYLPQVMKSGFMTGDRGLILPVELDETQPHNTSETARRTARDETALKSVYLRDQDDQATIGSDNEDLPVVEIPEANMLIELNHALDADWTLVQTQLPEDWMWDVEFQAGCWTCTPLESMPKCKPAARSTTLNTDQLPSRIST